MALVQEAQKYEWGGFQAHLFVLAQMNKHTNLRGAAAGGHYMCRAKQFAANLPRRCEGGQGRGIIVGSRMKDAQVEHGVGVGHALA